MKTYLLERLAIGSVLAGLFVFAAVTFNSKLDAWTFLLLFTVIGGFSHYLVGGFYQLKSFVRKPNKSARYIWWLVLSVLSLLVSGLALFYGQVNLFGLITVGYFMIHGFFNEITLYERTTAGKADSFVIATVALFLSGITVLAAAHPSAVFSAQLEFIDLNNGFIRMFQAESDALVIKLSIWLGSVFLTLSFVTASIAFYRSKDKMWRGIFFIFLLLVGTLLILHYPPSYIYILSSLLLYHFMIWFWFYLKQFMKAGKREVQKYIGIHLLVFVPFVFLAGSGAVADWLHFFILNSYVFLVLTTIHITTSFMSERWFIKYFLKEE